MALDEGSPQLELERVSRPPNGRVPAVLITLAAIFVAIAVIKPWPAPTKPTDSDSRPIRTAPAGTPQPTAVTGESGFFQQCFPTANWRLTAAQKLGSSVVRTVWPAAPAFVAAESVDDAVKVYGSGVQAIGFCAPGEEQATRIAQTAAVSLWWRDASGAIVPVEGARVIDSALASEGEVYFAPPSQLAENGEWPSGDYFFEISQARTGASPTWIAMQLTPPVVVAAPTAAPPRATPEPGA